MKMHVSTRLIFENPSMQQSDITMVYYSRKRKRTQVNPISKSSSSLKGSTFADQLSSYDIQNLPDSLLIEILARLPLKSIFRFKCVSKTWHTLISHPSFRKLYSLISNSSSSLLPFKILYKYVCAPNFKEVVHRPSLETYGCSKISAARFLSSFNEQPSHYEHEFKILSVSNGLILFGGVPRFYYVCDPVTGQCVQLPKGDHNYSGEGLVTRINQDDNRVTSFKVVKVCRYWSNYLKLLTFSSETGKWVSDLLLCTTKIKLKSPGACPINFNGILHWFVKDHGMVAYDPYIDLKSFRFIQFPDDRDVESKHSGIYRVCDECQGSLRYFEVANESSKFYCFRMWVMKDYEKGEWCCALKATRSDLHSTSHELNSWLGKATFRPLSFHPLDINFVYLQCMELGYIVSYDVQNKRLDVVSEANSHPEALSWRMVVPFVLRRWPMPFPVPPTYKPILSHRNLKF